MGDYKMIEKLHIDYIKTPIEQIKVKRTKNSKGSK